jgi:hypothetical protein
VLNNLRLRTDALEALLLPATLRGRLAVTRGYVKVRGSLGKDAAARGCRGPHHAQ